MGRSLSLPRRDQGSILLVLGLVVGLAPLLGSAPGGVWAANGGEEGRFSEDTARGQVLRGTHGELVCAAREVKRARGLLEVADRAWERQTQLLQTDSAGTFTLLVPDKEEEFRALTKGLLPEWGVGVAVPEEALIVLRPVRDAREDLAREEVVAHEVAHLVVARATGGREMPLWMEEGLAQMLSRRWTLQQWAALFWAVGSGALRPLSELAERFPRSPEGANAAYLESYSVVEFLRRELRDEGMADLLALIKQEGGLEPALVQAGGWDLERLEWEWREDLRRRYQTAAVLTLSSPLWGFLSLLAIAGFARRRWRAARWRRKWELEDAARGSAGGDGEVGDGSQRRDEGPGGG